MRKLLILFLLSLPAHALTLSEQVANIAPGTWAPITAENTASDVDPDRDPSANPWHPAGAWWRGMGYDGKWKAWNSGVLATIDGCPAVIYYGGGHNNYWGSDPTALILCPDAAPRWERLSDPYSASNPLPWPVPDGTLPDGSPVPQHTYDTLTHDPELNALVTFQAMSNGSTSTTVHKAFVFDLDTRQWTGAFAHQGAQYGMAAYDSSRGLHWFRSQNGYPGQLTSLDAETGALTYYGGAGLGLDAMLGYDPIRDRLAASNFRTAGTIVEHSLTDPTLPWKTAEQVNKPAVSGGNTWAWSAQREAWIVWMSKLGPDVWEVKRTGENPATGAPIYTWAALMDPSNTVTPIALGVGHNPSYDKFQLVTVGGVEVLIGQLRLDDGLFAFRLPGGTPPPPDPDPEPCIPVEYDVQPPLQFCPLASVCDQPGVFLCDEFTETRGGTLFKGDAMPVVEGGNLVLTLPSMSGPDAGGSYRVRFPAIGEGKFLALAYRVKADAAAVALPGRKEFILWRGSSSCTDLELSQSHRQDSAVLNPYTACGARNFAVPLGKYDFRLQYPDYNCTYHGIRKSLDGCAITVADRWESYYVELAIGHYGQPDSIVTMWQRLEGGEWQRYIHRDDYTLYGSGGFDRFMLTPYMTGKPRTEHPPGEVRYDYLVMATQPLDKALL